MIDTLLVIWFALTLISALFVGWDLYTRTPAMSVMKPGWILFTLYLGPIGLLIYVATCRPPRPGLKAHDEYIKPLWRQAAGSAVHCVSGDATGVIFAATFAAVFAVPSAVDVILEYTLGFMFGLFIFQALFMKEMLGGYWLAVKKTILSEWVSMNMVMAGMIPTMILLMQHVEGANHPLGLRYWAVMQSAAVIGYAIGYPANHWLVGHGVKHGMMTQRPKGEPMPGMQHDMGKMDKGEMPGHDMGGHDMGPTATTGQLVAITVLSLVFLAAGVFLAAHFGKLSFTAR